MVCFFADCTPLLERYVGFWLAYLVPCCCMWLALIPILLGRSHFGQSIFTSTIHSLDSALFMLLGLTG